MLISVGTLWRKELLSEVTLAKGYHESDMKDLIYFQPHPGKEATNSFWLWSAVRRSCQASTPPSPNPRRRRSRNQSPTHRRCLPYNGCRSIFWSSLFSQIFNSHLCSGPREDRKASRPEGAGFHDCGQGQDGKQAVQFTDGHVQRGHHRGDHDTGVSRVTPGKNCDSAPIRAV